MKMVLWSITLVGLASAGCIWDQSLTWRQEKTPSNDSAIVKPTRPRPPSVRPEQITEENASKVAQALEEELDADTRDALTGGENPKPETRNPKSQTLNSKSETNSKPKIPMTKTE